MIPPPPYWMSPSNSQISSLTSLTCDTQNGKPSSLPLAHRGCMHSYLVNSRPWAAAQAPRKPDPTAFIKGAEGWDCCTGVDRRASSTPGWTVPESCWDQRTVRMETEQDCGRNKMKQQNPIY
jgi:hypothetical protein